MLRNLLLLSFCLALTIPKLSSQSFWIPLAGPKGASIATMAATEDGKIIIHTPYSFKISTDGGETWADCDEGMLTPPFGAEKILASPDGNIYVLLYGQNTDGGPLYKLNQEGTGWIYLGLENIYAFSVNNQGHIYINKDFKIWRSTDDGLTFSEILVGHVYGARELYTFGNGNNYIYTITGLSADRRLFKFNDIGTSVEELTFPGYEDLYGMDMHPSGKIFQCGFGVFRSENGSTDWDSLQLVPDPINGQFTSEIVILPSGRIYALQPARVQYSDDEGETWQLVGQPLIGQSNGGDKLTYGNGKAFYTRGVCTANGFVRSEDGGNTWDDINENVATPYVQDFSIDHAGNLYSYSCRYPSYYERSTDGGEIWEPLIIGPNNRKVEKLWVSPNGAVFALSNYSEIFRSQDSGLSWEILTIPQGANWDAQLFFSPTGEMFYTNSNRLFKSSDYGNSWININFPPNTTDNSYVTNMAVNTSGDIFLTIEGIWVSPSTYRSTDDGATWTILLEDLNGAGHIHISNEDHIYFTPSYGTGIYVSYDNLETYSLSYATAENIENIISNSRGDVFAVTENQGVIRTIDDGINWFSLNEGIKTIQSVTKLAIDQQQYLYLSNAGDVIYKSTEPTGEANLVSGSVWFDESHDCQFDTTENALKGWLVKATGNGNIFYNVTGPNGQYNLPLPDGNYTLDVVLPGPLWDASCAMNTPVTFTTSPDSVLVDFPIKDLATCPALTVDVSTNLLRRCFQNNYYIHYCNIGTAPAQNATVQVTLDSYLSYQSSSVPLISQNGQVLIFGIGDIGINACGDFSIVLELSCDAELGQEHCVEATIFPDDCPVFSNEPSVECRNNIGSYDPNEKIALVEGRQENEWVLPNTELEFFIRFQNTGTDTAFNIEIEDRLSFWLDPNTVRPGASSHAYTWNISGGNKLQFFFKDIMLPDSIINEPASHGFIKFKVSQKNDAPFGNHITNDAAIIFDFNTPVYTNEIKLHIGEPTSTTEQKGGEGKIGLKVIPNPFSEIATIMLSNAKSPNFNYYLFNSLGQKLKSANFSGTIMQLDGKWLDNGVYIIVVVGNNGEMVAQKIVRH